MLIDRLVSGGTLRLLGTLALAWLLAACGPEPFRGTDVSGADYRAEFRLLDPMGRERRIGDFAGRAVVVFFGYTHCPDVCPTALAEAAAAMRALGGGAERVQVLFVTLDPERDTPEVLARYVPAFHPGFLGLRGDAAGTADAAQAFRVFHHRQPGSTPRTYTIDHSAGLYVLDTRGRLRLYLGHGKTGEDLAHDLRRLLREG